MKIPVSLSIIVLSLLFAFPSYAQKTTVKKLFDNQVEITLPKGAYINGYDDKPGQDGGWIVSLVDPSSSPGPIPTVSIMTIDLSPKQRNLTDAQWRKDLLSYYTDPKNKKKNKFKNYESGGKGKVLWVTAQTSFKDLGKTRTIRYYEKQVRISKREVVYAIFSTDKPGSWNTADSKRLRSIVASLRASKQ